MTRNLRISTIAACLFVLAFCHAPSHAANWNERALELVNVERTKAGVPPLRMNANLTDSARKYALYLGQAGFFSHVGPDGSTLVTRNIGAGYRNAIWLGENIAGGFTSPEAAVAAWMNSLPHRSNMLDPNFSEVGIANTEVAGSPYGHYWVQEFGMRRGVLPNSRRPSKNALQLAGRAPALPEPDRHGVVSAGGLLGDSQSSIAGQDEAAPAIAEISPATASHGSLVTIRGHGFGSSGVLRFGGLVARADSWKDTVITARVPQGAISAGVTVTNDAGIISRGVGFHITSIERSVP